MSRKAKLLVRLGELERQFMLLLIAELEAEIRKGRSVYLSTKRGDALSSVRDLLQIELVERDLTALLGKLGESVSDSWVSVANELASRRSAAYEHWKGYRPIQRSVSGTILGRLRSSAGVSEVKEAIRACLTAQRGVTGYHFNKEPLAKGLSYPIKRHQIDEAIRESQTDEIDQVSYYRRPWLGSRYRPAPSGKEGFREGELLLQTHFFVWKAKPGISITLYAIPHTATLGLKPHVEKTTLPALRDWLAFSRSAGPAWRSAPHSLEIGWHMDELRLATR